MVENVIISTVFCTRDLQHVHIIVKRKIRDIARIVVVRKMTRNIFYKHVHSQRIFRRICHQFQCWKWVHAH